MAPRAAASAWALLGLWARLTLTAFSPHELSSQPAAFDAATAKPPSLSWHEWCGNVPDDAMDVPLSNRSLALQRDTPWLQMRAATLDTLEFVAPRAAPLLWQRGSTVLDVGAASGELTRFIARKYGLHATALDVAAPENNSYARYKQRLGSWPVRIFDGELLPAADASYDVVMFIFSLHHAGGRAPALLREAARVARHTMLLVEACDLLDEATTPDARRAASRLRSKEFPCMGDRQAIFRSQAEWTKLIEEQGAWRVTRVGAVREIDEDRAHDADYVPSAELLAPPSGDEYRRFMVVQRDERRRETTVSERARSFVLE